MLMPIRHISAAAAALSCRRSVLKELSRNQRLAPQNAKMYQETYPERCGCSMVREGHRVALLIGQTSLAIGGRAAPPSTHLRLPKPHLTAWQIGRRPVDRRDRFQSVFKTT